MSIVNAANEDSLGQLPAKRRKLHGPKPVKLSTPCGFALCSTCDDVMKTEVLISSRGVPQGATLKSKRRQLSSSSTVSPQMSSPPSVLSKAAFFASFLSIAEKWGGKFQFNGSALHYNHDDELATGSVHLLKYRQAKQLPSTYRIAKDHILNHPVFEHWMRCDTQAFESFEVSAT